MTGPSVEINFMGYAMPGQRGQGIHQRLRARSFAFQDDNKRAVFVSVDGGMGSDLVKLKVLDRLNEELGVGVYTMDNVAISGTHTHSGPAGYLQYVLYQVTSLGYVKETFDAWVNGIASSIIIAHRNLQPAKTLVSSGKLYESNINRSPTSYLLNPQEERDAYPDGDTDKTMLQLTFKSATQTLGVLNWFAVHGTSLNNTNTLTSGDNRGYASYALEKEVNGDVLTGKGSFVAAFASTNLGDVSPNTMGAKCIDTGLPCEGGHSTCNGKCENCIAFGPGTNGDMFESCQIIGGKQADFAKSLMDSATEAITGPIDYRHSFVNMPSLNVTIGDTVKQLCLPAMGYSFAAGTTDGPGMFNFTQGTTSGNAFWDKVRDFLDEPTPEQIACQAPKPIFINTGGIEVPYMWDPETVPVQILRIGNLFILSAPSEFTTMAGRRLRKAVQTILESGNLVRNGKVYVTIAGLTNTYSSYVTTYEEYQAQRYEAASNIFGPHALDGYIQEFSRLARDMVSGRVSTSDAPPPDLTEKLIQLMPESHYDRVPMGVNFGDVITDAKPSYSTGEVVSVSFHAANPRHNLRVGGTYLTVEQKTSNHWKIVANDGDWSTKFRWLGGKEDPLDLGFSKQSTATITWQVDNIPGTYRICYHGDHLMNKSAKVLPFTGCSSEFAVSA
jgi:neutral ceramidase